MALGQWRINSRNHLRPGAGYGLGPNHAKNKRVFIHGFDWPSSALDVDRLQAKVISANLLTTGQALKFRQTQARLQIDLPAHAPDPNVSTIVVNIL